jgi:hypothetical protein
LLAVPTFGEQPFRVDQFAIWTVIENPRRHDYVHLGTAFEIIGSGPSDEELGTIRDLFEEAGIDPADYRALR